MVRKTDKQYVEEFDAMPPEEQDRVRGLRSGLSLPVAMSFHREFEEIKRSQREAAERFERIAKELRDDSAEQRGQLLDAVKAVIAETSKATLELIERLEKDNDRQDERIGCLESTAREHDDRFVQIEGDVRAIKKQVGIPG
jgi:flagellar motility protein MotE (MotC chaperone)